MQKIIFLISFCLPLAVLSQNLTGTWEGSGGGTTYIKMVIRQRGDSLFGYTYDEGHGYCKATFIGRYDKKHKNLTGHGVKMIERTPNHVLVDYDMVYSKEPRGEFLREKMGEEDFIQSILGPNSREYLKKTSNKVDLPQPAPSSTRPVTPVMNKVPVKKPVAAVVKKPFVKAPPLKQKPSISARTKILVPVPNKELAPDTVKRLQSLKPVERKKAPAALVKIKDERSSKLVQTIYTSADTVKMFVYDNGVVDGDTVTVFFDNAIILDRYRISETAKEISLPISKNGQEHYIELFANNLGTIPPNTALIIITAGKKRYELHASYDLKTNARIVVQYRE